MTEIEYNDIIKSIEESEIEYALKLLDAIITRSQNKELKTEYLLIISSFNHKKNEVLKGLIENDVWRNKITLRTIDLTEKTRRRFNHEKKSSKKVENKALLPFKIQEKKERIDLKEHILNSKKIDFLCYSCIGLFDRYSSQLTQSILNGAEVRVMHIKPESKAFNLMLEHSRVRSMSADIMKIQKRIQLIYKSLENQNKSLVKNLQVKYLTWIPSTTLLIFDGNKDIGFMSIKSNPLLYTTPLSERLPSQIIKKENNLELFSYYRIQYEHLWKFSDSIDKNFKDNLGYYGDRIFEK